MNIIDFKKTITDETKTKMNSFKAGVTLILNSKKEMLLDSIKSEYINNEYPDSFLVDDRYINYFNISSEQIDRLFSFLGNVPVGADRLTSKQAYDGESDTTYRYYDYQEILDFLSGLDDVAFFYSACFLARTFGESPLRVTRDFCDTVSEHIENWGLTESSMKIPVNSESVSISISPNENAKNTRETTRKEKTIFLSYCSKDSDIANFIDISLTRQISNIKISKYTRDVGYKDSFKSFMKSVEQHDFVITIVSDRYLKSRACMFEVGELIKDNEFQKRIIFVVLSDKDKTHYKTEPNESIQAEIYDPVKRNGYTLFWQKEYKKLEESTNQLESPTSKIEPLKIMCEIKRIFDYDMGEFLKYLSDAKGLSLSEHIATGFKEIINVIEPCYKINKRGNTTSSVMNNGFLAQQGEWVYYKNYSRKFLRIGSDGMNKTQICADNVQWINVIGDWVYYANEDDGSNVYRIHTDGSDKQRLNDVPSSYVSVVGDWIYYTDNYDFSSINRMRVDGSDNQKLNRDFSSDINIVDDWIFYLNGHANHQIVSKMRIDGCDKTNLLDDNISRIIVVDDWIYYTSPNHANYAIFKMRIDGTENMRIITPPDADTSVQGFYVSGDWLVIYYYGTKYLCKMHLRTGVFERITSIVSPHYSNIHVVDKWIYLISLIGGSLYRVHIDSGECHLVD